MERDACIARMFEEFQCEKSRHQDAQRQQNEREKAKLRDPKPAEELAKWMNDGEKSMVKCEKTEPEETESEGSEDMSGYTDELTRLKELEVEATDTLNLIRNRIAAIEACREGNMPAPNIPGAKPRSENRTFVDEYTGEDDARRDRVFRHREMSEFYEKRPREQLTDAPEVFLRIKLDGITKVFFAENSRNECEIGARPIRMQNGIQVRYMNGVLEMRGSPRVNSTFQIISVCESFRLLVAPRFAEVNETYAMTADGLLIRALCPKGLPHITEHVFTLFGPLSRTVGVEYKGHRYRLTFEEKGAVMTAELH